ncbi:hypothetical protein GCM10011498_37240 [Amylibacter cionae]|uniref:Uncharacterized protein n=1 Tax=Neptunicoccus cionae TaxID=2035344 RepID=A0A916R2F1_9RHOB|nr:hypothetical protein [Roseobacter sp. N2S]GGA32603.1 hypothetical protein GCM10011498_37240 [Amylibacter cionae]
MHTRKAQKWCGPQAPAEDTVLLFWGCVRENPAGSKAIVLERRIALARTPKGP